MNNINFIPDFSEYFNVKDLQDSYLWTYVTKIQINNAEDLFEQSVNKIQIVNNNQVCETIYLNSHIQSKLLLDIYLSDGLNKLQFVLLGENNTIQKSEIINVHVNIFPELIKNEKLLTNFIGNDDQMISLCTGNADLEYATSAAGENKDVNIDLDIKSHYFKLEGVNSDLYQISKEDIPLIKSTIIPRPLGITFNEVSKEYDGTCDITEEVKKLELNNGYKFTDVNKEYNDFGDTGFVDEIFETNTNKTTLFKKYDEIPNEIVLNTNNLDISSLKLNIDGIKLVGQCSDDNNNDVLNWYIHYNNPNDIKKYAKSTCDNILKGKYHCNNLCYCEIEIPTINPNEPSKKIYKAIDPIGCYDENNVMIKDPLVYETSNEDNALLWLKALDHKIIDFSFKRTKSKVFDSTKNDYVEKELPDNNIIIVVNYFDDELYKVQDKIIIEFNYLNNSKNVYVDSDYGYVKVNFMNAYFENKNVEDNKKPIRLYDLKFEGDVKGDKSSNYQIANYTIVGSITKRPIIPHITFIDKIYDGLTNVAFTMDSAYYNGLENSIKDDNVKIDTKCKISDKTIDGKVNVETGLTKFYFDDCNVGENKSIRLGNIVLEGEDAINYKIEKLAGNFEATIKKRPIKIKINRIKLYRSDLRWEVDYEFNDAISSDNLTISINSNDNYQFKVYARNLSEDSKNNDFNTNDVLSTYFTYDFNNNYKFEDAIDNKEIQPIYETKTKRLYYNVKEAMPAEPNTERINVIPELDTKYTGNVVLNPILVKDSFVITDEFNKNNKHNISNIVTSFYESQDKQSKIYDGCKVKVTNICLDPYNNKSDNYILLNTKTETILEII